MTNVHTHPIQLYGVRGACAPAVLTMRAYEVYCHICGPQEAMITGNCRGGFGVGELLAFLYARSFPKDEWKMRFNEALQGMKIRN